MIIYEKQGGNKMVKQFIINVFDIIYPDDHETSYDLKKIKIKEIDKFTGDIILEAEYTEDKS